MNSLIAKIGKEYKNVVSKNDKIIENLSIDEIVPIDFSPNYKLDENEWFKLSDFSNKNYFIEICKDNYSTTNLNQVNNSDYQKTSHIVLFQEKQKHFQRITSTRFVNQKRFVDFSGEPKIVEQNDQLEIKLESDAVYVYDKDVLYFRDIGKIKYFFPRIDEIYRQATNEEVNNFLDNSFIKLQNDYNTNSVSVLNRKRITDIGTKYQSLTEDKKKNLISYVKEKSGLDLTDKDKLKISSEIDLKTLLFAMDQRYYDAEIYEEKRFANSIRTIN